MTVFQTETESRMSAIGSASVLGRVRRKLTQTCLPSVAGVLLAKLLSECFGSSGEVTTVRRHNSVPLTRSKARSKRSCVLGSQLVRKTRSPCTIGEEWPTPGTGAFQATLSAALHLRGKFFSDEWPSRRGPRHMGQSSAWREAGSARRSNEATR